MAEVKRYDIVGGCYAQPFHAMEEVEDGDYVLHSDYASLERERDHYKAFHDETMPVLEAAQGLRNRLDAAERAMAAQAAELTRLRAVEADYAALQGFMRDRMPALIAARLAADDGYDPQDQHGGLYDLRWSGGSNPEPAGDVWSMDYLPRGEKIAADLAEACGRKG